MFINPRIVRAIVALAFSGLAFVEYRSIVKREQQKRFEIRAQSAREFEAIFAAANRVKQNIDKGHYSGKSLEDLRSDLEFYRIAHLNQQ